MDGFLEVEGLEAMGWPISRLPSQMPKWVKDKTFGTAHRVVDHRLIYDIVTQSASGAEAEGTVDVPTVVAQLKKMSSDVPDSLQSPLGIL